MKCMIIITSSTNCKVTSKEASPLLQNCEPMTAVGFELNVVMDAQRRVCLARAFSIHFLVSLPIYNFLKSHFYYNHFSTNKLSVKSYIKMH